MDIAIKVQCIGWKILSVEENCRREFFFFYCNPHSPYNTKSADYVYEIFCIGFCVPGVPIGAFLVSVVMVI